MSTGMYVCMYVCMYVSMCMVGTKFDAHAEDVGNEIRQHLTFRSKIATTPILHYVL
jgi:hypothetical protein